MSDSPFPFTAQNLEELIRQTQKMFDDLYQDRIGGAQVGDVFEIDSADILSLKLSDAGGLEKASAQLKIKVSPTGGLQVAVAGASVKCKAGGGLTSDATGLSLAGTNGLTIGAGVAGVDYNLTFDGETNDGILTWMEDEDYFDFADTVRVPSIHIDADVAGIAATTTFTGVTDTPTADPGWATSSTVNMTAPDAYIKIYIGTQAYVIPAWLT